MYKKILIAKLAGVFQMIIYSFLLSIELNTPKAILVKNGTLKYNMASGGSTVGRTINSLS
jgi:hypothetical protein